MDLAAETTAAAVERYGALVLKIAWQILPQTEEVRDLFQETFLRFHQVCRRGEVIAYPQAWLCRTATHAALKRRRQRRREVLVEEIGEAPATGEGEQRERDILLEQVRQLIAGLPDRQREVFWRRNFEGLSFARISAQLGCSEESARANEYKALKKIKAWIGQEGNSPR